MASSSFQAIANIGRRRSQTSRLVLDRPPQYMNRCYWSRWSLASRSYMAQAVDIRLFCLESWMACASSVHISPPFSYATNLAAHSPHSHQLYLVPIDSSASPSSSPSISVSIPTIRTRLVIFRLLSSTSSSGSHIVPRSRPMPFLHFLTDLWRLPDGLRVTCDRSCDT